MNTTLEYKLVWPRRDRNEDQHQVFRTVVSMENKKRKLALAGYEDVLTFVREVKQDKWIKVS